MSADYVVHATVLVNSPRTRWLLSCTEGRHGSLHRQRNQFSVAIPVATRRQALALQGTDEDTGSGRASSPGTLWAGSGRCGDGIPPFRITFHTTGGRCTEIEFNSD